MGKSSSSHKKKRSKNPSKTRMKKRNKSGSRRYESKKLRHRRHDSLSFSDDGDSKSSVSFSSYSSSSEDNHRSKRARSRTRKDMISKKKRARRRSCSHESSEDSPHVRKRKRLKRNRDYKSKKKTHPKKKPRRDASASSTDGSISSHEIEFKRHRSRCGKEDVDERKFKKVKSRNEMSRYRSRSRSLCSQCSDYRTNEKVLGEKNFRRLRSVITVTEKDNEGREFNMDEHKEEVIYFHDDYPSCRSNDSNDGGSKREEDHHSHFGSEEKMRLEKEQGDEAVVSNVRISNLERSGKICDRYGDGLYSDSTLNRDELGIIDSSNGRTSDVSGVIGSLNGDDLESLLRQRALENLRKFQGGLRPSAKTSANQKDKDYSDVKQSSPAKVESVQNKSLEEDTTRVVGAKSSKEDNAGVVGSNRTQLVKVVSMPRVNKDATHSSQNHEKIPDGNTGNNETISAKQNIEYPTDQMAVSGNNSEIVKSAGSVQPKLVTPALRCHSSITQSSLKQALVSPQLPGGKLVVAESSLDEVAAVTAPTVTESSNKNGLNINNTCGSGAPEPSSNLTSTSGDNRSDTMQDEVKEGSQFEQKTMSVMRGGEMVQVSYKVYIPKKAPALARRQLKR